VFLRRLVPFTIDSSTPTSTPNLKKKHLYSKSTSFPPFRQSSFDYLCRYFRICIWTLYQAVQCLRMGSINNNKQSVNVNYNIMDKISMYCKQVNKKHSQKLIHIPASTILAEAANEKIMMPSNLFSYFP
jgi:hypothetical protein